MEIISIETNIDFSILLPIAVVGGKPSFEPIEIDPKSKYVEIPKGTFGVINLMVTKNTTLLMDNIGLLE